MAKLDQRKRECLRAVCEPIERRLMLAVSATVNGSGLLDIDISGAGGDSVNITVQAGNVKINGADPSTGPAAASSITEIDVLGGSGPDDIDLSGVNSANGFANLNGKVTVLGEGANDTITGSAFNDLLNGKTGADSVNGGDGDDTLDGGSGAEPDTLVGDAGNDSILGGAGNDSLSGGADQDTLFGGAGTDIISGGADQDLIVHNPGDGDQTVDGDAGTDTLQIGGVAAGADVKSVAADLTRFEIVNAGTVNAGTVERIDFFLGNGANVLTIGDLTGVNDLTAIQAFGGADADHFDASAQANANISITLSGQGGNDTLTGGAGNDFVVGNDDDDSVSGGLGNDTVAGDAGTDTLDAGAGDDSAFGGTGDDSISGGADDDFIDGGGGIDTLDGQGDEDLILGGDDGDSMRGGDGIDTLDGQAGNSTLHGEGGGDLLIGGDDNDDIDGGQGDDTVDGGLGSDTITGGPGDDQVFAGPTEFTFVALTADNQLKIFGEAGTITTIPITGLQPGDNLLGIEAVKSADGVILLAPGDTNQTYRIDINTGQVIQTTSLNGIVSGSHFGVATRPEDGSAAGIAVVSNIDEHASIFSSNGNVTDRPAITYRAGDANAGQDPNVVAIARHDFEIAGNHGYVIDSNLDVVARLDEITSELTTIGSLGVNTGAAAGFDLEFGSDGVLRGFATLEVGGTSGLYEINLETGAATFIRALGMGSIHSVTSWPDDDDALYNSGDGDDTVQGGVGANEQRIDFNGRNAEIESLLGGFRFNDLDADEHIDLSEDFTVIAIDASGSPEEIILQIQAAIQAKVHFHIVGSNFNDSIDALGGRVSVKSGSGDDTVKGSPNNDTIEGGDGNDSIEGGDGADSLEGGKGNDSMQGNEGDDSLGGGFGMDSLDGGTSVDFIQGGDISGSRVGLALTDNNQVVPFEHGVGFVIGAPLNIDALEPGEVALKIDTDPFTGKIILVTNFNQLYDWDFSTQTANSPRSLGAALSGMNYGFDLDPSIGYGVTVSDADQFTQFDVATGATIQTRTLRYAMGDVNDAADPNVIATAFFNNYVGAATTGRFYIDSAADVLAMQTPGFTAKLTTVGPLGFDTSANASLDISGDNTTYGALRVGGVSGLYAIDPLRGGATHVGNFGQNIIGLALDLDNDSINVNLNDGDDTVQGGLDHDRITVNGGPAADDFHVGFRASFDYGMTFGIEIVPVIDVEKVIFNGGDGDDEATVDLLYMDGLFAPQIEFNGQGDNDTLDLSGIPLLAPGGRLSGGGGNDLLIGSPNGDMLIGDSGTDTTQGGGGADTHQGGTGNDQLTADSAFTFISLGEGATIDIFTRTAEINSIPITGLQAGDVLIGIHLGDLGPFGQQLFGIGKAGFTYRLNLSDGSAELLATTTPFTGNEFAIHDLGGRFVSVISDNGGERILDLFSGETEVQPNIGPNLVGSALGMFGEEINLLRTSAFGILPNRAEEEPIEYFLDAASNSLMRRNTIGEPLVTVGPLGVDITGSVGFEIDPSDFGRLHNGSPLTAPGAFALLQVAGGSSGLYEINLITGAATLLRNRPTGDSLQLVPPGDVFIWIHGDGSDTVDGGVGGNEQRVNIQQPSVELEPSTTPFDFRLNLGANGQIELKAIQSLVIEGDEGPNALHVAPGLSPATSPRVRFSGNSGSDSADASNLPAGGRGMDFDGGAGNDTAQGSPNADTLEGGADNDTLSGGDGHDQYHFDADGLLGIDTLNESLNQGIDSLDFRRTRNLGVTVDLSNSSPQNVNLNLTLDLNDADNFDNLVGGSADDNLNGNDGPNVIGGGAGNDTITGGRGGDTIDGGDGENDITGGPANSTFVGLTSVPTLIVTDENGDVERTVVITGLQSGETIVGFDTLPQHVRDFDAGELSDLAANLAYGVSNQNRIYAIDLRTGQATSIATLTVPLSGTRFGLTLHPTQSEMHILSDTGQHLKVSSGFLGIPVTTELPAAAYAPGDPNAGQTPNLVALAFDFPFDKLLVIDSDLDVLAEQDPDTGQLTTIGSLGIDVTSSAGFDVDPAVTSPFGLGSPAFGAATLTVGGITRLYKIDLENGHAIPAGLFAGGTQAIEGLSDLPEYDFFINANYLEPQIVTGGAGIDKQLIDLGGNDAAEVFFDGQTVLVNVGGVNSFYSSIEQFEFVNGSVTIIADAGAPDGSPDNFVIDNRPVDPNTVAIGVNGAEITINKAALTTTALVTIQVNGSSDLDALVVFEDDINGKIDFDGEALILQKGGTSTLTHSISETGGQGSIVTSGGMLLDYRGLTSPIEDRFIASNKIFNLTDLSESFVITTPVPGSVIDRIDVPGWGSINYWRPPLTLAVNAGGGNDSGFISATPTVPPGGVTIDMGTGSDDLEVLGDAAVSADVQPDDAQTGAGSVTLSNGRQVQFQNLEPDTLTLSNFTTVTLTTPNANDVIDITSDAAGTNRVSGTSGAVQFVSLVISDVSTLVLDTAANDAGAGNDAITISTDGLVATGLTKLQVNAGTGTNTLTVNGGDFVLDTNPGIGGVNLTVNVNNTGTHVTFDESQNLEAISIGAGAKVTLAASGADVLRTLALTTAPTGQLDLTNNQLVLDYDAGGPSPLETVIAQIASGHAGGAWSGNGIRTSLGNVSNFALGYAESSALLGIGGGDFAGQQVDGSAILVRYTFYGDTDLDRDVDLSDLGNLATHFGGTTGKLWGHGDFDYDRDVDLADLGALATNYGFELS